MSRIESNDKSRKRGPCDPLLPHKLSDTATSSLKILIFNRPCVSVDACECSINFRTRQILIQSSCHAITSRAKNKNHQISWSFCWFSILLRAQAVRIVYSRGVLSHGFQTPCDSVCWCFEYDL